MADVSMYCPGATRVRGGVSGGSMLGGPPRAVWHTYECSYSLDAVEAMKRLHAVRYTVQLCYNPVSGALSQGLPADVAGRGLEHPRGTPHTNRYGQYCVQIEVLARASRPWTQDLTPKGAATLRRILEWLHSLGIPYVFPSGSPPGVRGPFPRDARIWASHAGHYGHSQVPYQPTGHWDPGQISTKTFFDTLSSQEQSVQPEPEPEPKQDLYHRLKGRRMFFYARFALAGTPYNPNNPTLDPKIYELWPVANGGYGSVLANNARDVFDGVPTVVFDTEAHLLAAYPQVLNIIDTLPVR